MCSPCEIAEANGLSPTVNKDTRYIAQLSLRYKKVAPPKGPAFGNIKGSRRPQNTVQMEAQV
jgi:hypothetical protein